MDVGNGIAAIYRTGKRTAPGGSCFAYHITQSDSFTGLCVSAGSISSLNLHHLPAFVSALTILILMCFFETYAVKCSGGVNTSS